jgi:MFS family permease
MTDGYRTLLRTGAARRLLGATATAWVAFGMVSLSILLAAREASGSFAAAGAALAVFAVGAALAPVRGRLVDRRGPRAVLPWLGAGYATALAALAAVSATGGGTVAVVPLAAAVGLLSPPLIATARGLWPAVVQEGLLRRVWAVNAALSDAMLALGPAAAGGLAAVHPALPLSLIAAAALAASLLMASAAPARTPAAAREPHHLLGPLVVPGMRTLVATGMAFGAAAGFLEVALPAAAFEAGVPAAAGPLLATVGIGSVAGGLWFGRRSHAGIVGPYLAGLGLLAAGIGAAAAVAHSLPVLAAVLVAAGLGLGPANVCLFELLEVVAPRRFATEALTWVTTAEAAGLAGGSAVAGGLVEASGPRACLAASAGAFLVAAGLAVARRETLTKGP